MSLPNTVRPGLQTSNDQDNISAGEKVGIFADEARARLLEAGAMINSVVTTRPAVALGNVEILFVGRNCDSVRAIDVGRHQAGAGLALNPRTARTKANEHNFVCRFANHVNQVVLGGPSRGNGRGHLRSAAEAEREKRQQDGQALPPA